MSGQWYLGFGASTALFEMNRDYRVSLIEDSEKIQASKLYLLLAEFADECLDQYFLTPVKGMQMNGVTHKMVVGGVSAIKKTLHLTLKQVINKLSAQDREQLANYINGLMLQLRESTRYPTYIAVPISSDLRQRLHDPVINGRSNPAAVKDNYVAALCELIDEAVHAYMELPIKMLKLGMVMNKVATVASETIKGAAHAVVKKVLHSMDDQEVQQFFAFSESILYQLEDRLVV